ncbi:MAG: insulinase family protein, partial [Crocinitomicaceae bacterium]|nr:insulinase family protein [Crocinitomicaceae bacterium]
ENDKAGYVEFAGKLLGSGTTTKTKAQIDEATDFIGATLSTSYDGIYAACLTKHSDALLKLMTDVLFNPSFPADELEKTRKQILSSLASEKTDPDAASDRIGNLVRYGKDHPYGQSENEESVKSITRDDIVNYYKTFFKPNVAYLVIVGDITPDKAKEQAQQYFGNWEAGTVKELSYPAPQAPKANTVDFVPMPGAVQSVIDITYPIDLKPGTQDAIVANVLNNILGGSGFQSRLMQNLREDKAYTYGAYSTISPDEVIGYFSAGASVRNEVTDSSVTELLYEMKQLVDQPVPDSTLNTIKNIITGNFARSLERPQTVANFALNIEKYHLPKDYYETYLQKLNAVTVTDIQNAARKWLKPENSHIVVVGNRDIIPSLKKFSVNGSVNLYNPDGTVFKELKPAKQGLTAETVLKNYIQAIGGEKNLKKIKSFQQKGQMTVGQMSLDVVMKMKNRTKYSFIVSMGSMEAVRQVYNGQKMIISQMGQKADGSEDEIRDMKMQNDLLLETHYGIYGITPVLKGIDVIDGKEAYVIDLVQKKGSATHYFDIASGLRVKSIETSESDGEAMTSESLYKSYITVGKGIKFPSLIEQNEGGQNIVITIQEVTLNPKFEDSDFNIQ